MCRVGYQIALMNDEFTFSKKKKGAVASTSEVTMNDDSDDDNATAMTMLDKVHI